MLEDIKGSHEQKELIGGVKRVTQVSAHARHSFWISPGLGLFGDPISSLFLFCWKTISGSLRPFSPSQRLTPHPTPIPHLLLSLFPALNFSKKTTGTSQPSEAASECGASFSRHTQMAGSGAIGARGEDPGSHQGVWGPG